MSEIREARLKKANSLLNKGFASYAESFRVSHTTKYLIQKFDYLENGQEEEFSVSKDYNKTLILCHSTVGKAILNTSITIVFGFSILVLSKFIPTIYFGIFTGLAMLLAMVSVLTLLPSLILLIKPFNK